MHLDEIRQLDTTARHSNTLTFTNISKEVKIAFPFIDIISNSWMIFPNGPSIDTIPAITYSTKRAVNRSGTNQFYRYLLARLSRDTVVLLKK